MMRNKFALLAAIGALTFTSVAIAAQTTPADVKFTDGEVAKSLTGEAGDPVKGRKIFANRKQGNCLACHVNSDMKDEQQFHGEVGPTMDGVASRYEPAQLRAILINSKQVFGDQTIMPSFYRDAGFNRTLKKFNGKTILSAQQVEDVLAYVMTLKDKE